MKLHLYTASIKHAVKMEIVKKRKFEEDHAAGLGRKELVFKMVSPKRSRSVIVISSASDVFDDSAPLDSINNTRNGEQNKSSQNKRSPPDVAQFHPAASTKHEIFIGNLKHDVPDLTIIKNLQELFYKKVNLAIPDFRFQLFQRESKKHPRKYGFVLLANETDEETAYKLDGQDNLDFVIEGLKLNVTKRLSARNRLTKWNKITFNGRRCLVNRSKSDTLLPAVRKINESKGKPSSHKRQFYYGQYLPTEDRVTEYKRGSGNYLKNVLTTHVRKYVCAFLNSEGGRLIIGVEDTCKVFGISCTRKQEDVARCQIDNIIKYFQPHVPPHMYMVEFIPVSLMSNEMEELDSIDPLLKVLEITVVKQSIQSTLYTTDKEDVYVRRDGSVEGPLKTSQIIEWCRTYFANIIIPTTSCEPSVQIKTALCNRCSDNQLDRGGDIAERLEEIIKHQSDVLKTLEGSLLEGHVQLRQQLNKLQENVEKKDCEIKDLSQNLGNARLQLENVKMHSPKQLCIII